MSATATEARRNVRRASAHVWISYARLSRASERKADGKGASLQIEQQHGNNRAYILSVDPDAVIVELSDDGFSAFLDVFRPDFEKGLGMIERGEARGFVGWHADRISRQMAVTARLFATCERAGVELHTSLGGHHADPDSLYFETMVAERESRQKRRRMLESHKGKAARGEWGGGPRPYGYAATADNRGLVVVPEEAAVIVEMAGRVLNGEALASIARDLNRREIPTTRGGAWQASPIRRILLSPTVGGLRDHDGKEHAAAWAAILNPTTRGALVRKLTAADRRTSFDTRNKWLLSGLALCGNCAAPLRGAYAGALNRGIYRCTACHKVSRDMAKTDAVVRKFAVARLEEMDASGSLVSDADNREAAALAVELEALEGRLDGLSDRHAAGLIDDEDLDRDRAAIKRRRKAVRAALDALTDRAAAPQRALEGATGPDAALVWDGWASDTSGEGLARQRAVVALLLDVRIAPATTGRGQRAFNPADIDVRYRCLACGQVHENGPCP